MRIPGIKTARHFARWLQARLFGGGMILGYHRVSEGSPSGDPYQNCVSPRHFAEQMAVISKTANPLPLSDFVQRMQAGSLPPRSVAVTFDDGYLDNLHQALPVLEMYQIPAAVFICTGYLGRVFWWDELVDLIASSTASLRGLNRLLAQSLPGWDATAGAGESGPETAPNQRQETAQQIYRFLFTRDIGEINQVMQLVRDWACLPAAQADSQRLMNQDELVAFEKHSLIELGAHTRHHLLLPALSPDRQREEILGSQQDLEAILGHPVRGFAYPHGRPSTLTGSILQAAGFSYACISLPNVIRPGCDPFRLTRFWQKDVDGRRFERSLSTWLKR